LSNEFIWKKLSLIKTSLYFFQQNPTTKQKIKSNKELNKEKKMEVEEEEDITIDAFTHLLLLSVLSTYP